jgi:putative endonuclease
MTYSFYIIYSSTLDRYYIGHTEDLTKRLVQHNNGESTYTSKASDWLIAYTESFDDRKTAHGRELEVKRKKSRKYLEWLISSVA